MYRPGDEETLRALNAYGLAAAGIPAGADYYAGVAADFSPAPGGVLLVGEVDGAIVAMGAMRRLDDATCEVLRMRVYSDHQGHGYGSAILVRLEDEARLLGYRRTTLITGEEQHPAVDLYARHGYTIERREVLLGIPSVHMGKNLAPA